MRLYSLKPSLKNADTERSRLKKNTTTSLSPGAQISQVYADLLKSAGSLMEDSVFALEQSVANTTEAISDSIQGVAENLNQRVRKVEQQLETTKTAAQNSLQVIAELPQNAANFPKTVKRRVTAMFTPPPPSPPKPKPVILQALELLAKTATVTGSAFLSGFQSMTEYVRNGRKPRVFRKENTFSISRSFTSTKDAVYDFFDVVTGSRTLKKVRVIDTQSTSSATNMFSEAKDATYDSLETIPQAVSNVVGLPGHLSTNTISAFKRSLIDQQTQFTSVKDQTYASFESTAQIISFFGKTLPAEASKSPARLAQVFARAERTVFTAKESTYNTFDELKKIQENVETTVGSVRSVPEKIQNNILQRRRSKGLDQISKAKIAAGRIKQLDQVKEQIYWGLETVKAVADLPSQVQKYGLQKKREIDSTIEDIASIPTQVSKSVEELKVGINQVVTSVTALPSSVEQTVTGTTQKITKKVSATKDKTFAVVKAIAETPEAAQLKIEEVSIKTLSFFSSLKNFGKPARVPSSQAPPKPTDEVPSPQQSKASQLGQSKTDKDIVQRVAKTAENIQSGLEGSVQTIRNLPDSVSRTVLSPLYTYKQRSDKVKAAVLQANLEQRLSKLENTAQEISSLGKKVLTTSINEEETLGGETSPLQIDILEDKVPSSDLSKAADVSPPQVSENEISINSIDSTTIIEEKAMEPPQALTTSQTVTDASEQSPDATSEPSEAADESTGINDTL